MNNHELIEMNSVLTPSLLRRIAAILYDCLVLSGLLIVAAALVVVPLGALFGTEIHNGSFLFRIYLSAVIFVYFAGFWLGGGQTPGMRAWRLRLVREDGRSIHWPDALARCLAALLSWAPCAMGFLWLVFDKDALAWHDRLSHTRLVMLKR